MGTRTVVDETDEFLTRVAWLYYVNGMTQSEIADQMGRTRLRINKAIAEAHQSGIVRIEISSPFASALALQDALIEKFSLRSAFVALANPLEYDAHIAVGTALAFFLNEELEKKDWKKIGVSWGMTLERALERLKQGRYPELEIVALMGGTTRGASFNAFGVAANFAQKLGAQYSLFAAPVYMESVETTYGVTSSEAYRTQMDKIRETDIAIVVAGDMSDRSFLIRDGLPNDVSVDELRQAGAVGDILGRFLDREGQPIPHSVNSRAIGVSIETLASLKHVALAAAGPHKVEIIRAGLRSGIVHTLITDDVTAQMLLDDGLGE